jgi:prepilin signal peptidase PulO-like enzyme (type II secretory pathway)
VIHLTVSQQQVSLKAENLVKASWMEQMRGQVELLQNNADIQQQIGQFSQRIQTATQGRLNIQKVMILLGVLVLMLIYGIGFSKTLLLLSFIILMGIIIAPDLKSPSVTLRQVVQNLPLRVKTVIRQQVPYYGNVIADNHLYTAALVGLVLAFFVNAMLQGKGTVVAPSRATVATPAWLSPTRLWEKLGLASGSDHVGTSSGVTTDDGGSTIMNTVLDASSSSSSPPIVRPYISQKSLLADAYKRGFDDATSQKEFGTSLEELLQRQEERQMQAATADFHDDPIISPPPPAPRSSSIMSASSIFSLLYIGRTLYSAGQTADHGFDVPLMMANLRTMDTMRLAMLGFSMYRLVSPLLL